MSSEATRLEMEREAEVLAVHQLDLLAQLEAQLRAVHRLMRRIQQLRVLKPGQVAAELANGQRSAALGGLSDEMEAIEQQVDLQHKCCAEMQAIIMRMQERLPVLKTAADRLSGPNPETQTSE